jgi:clathrin heavy chain
LPIQNRISGENIFITAELEATSGIIGVNKRGQVLSVGVDEQAMVPYILNVLNNTELAVKLASRANLPSADDLYVQQYNQLFATGQYSEAAKIDANSPRVRTILVSAIPPDADLIFYTRASCAHRNHRAIQAGSSATWYPVAYPAILRYPPREGELNKHNSLELARPVLAQGHKQLLEKWLKENKVFPMLV